MSDDLVPEKNEPPRQSGMLLWLTLIPLIGTLGFGVWLLTRPPEEGKGANFNAFNLAEVPKENAGISTAGPLSAPVPPPPKAEVPGGPGLSGFVPESDPLFVGKKTGAPAGAASSSGREQDFLKKYDPAIRKYQESVLGPLAGKYYRTSPVVREVDAAFGRMNRYMDVCAQYQRDRDIFKWARGVAALPEVRQAVVKYALRPDVWQVAVKMGSEAMKTPPPKPIHDEITRFLSSDKTVGGAITDVTRQVTPRLGTLLTQGVPPGVDIAPLANLTKAIVPGGSAVPGVQTRPSPARAGEGRR